MRAVRVVAFALLLALAVARAPRTDAEIEKYTFEQYNKDFGKNYVRHTAEYTTRQSLFEKKKLEVLAHNKDAAASKLYRKGINDLSDKTGAEFKKRLGGKLHQQYDTLQKLRKSAPGKIKTHVKSGMAIPDSIDWRNRVPSIFSAIKDQGDCGSCWAHASTENLESHWALRTGQLFALSQQQITACAPNPHQCGGTGGCLGSTAELAYAYLASFGGIASTWTYPYTAYNGTTGTCRASNQITPTDVKVTGYTNVAQNDLEAVMDAIAHVGPLAINVDASQWSDYAGGIYHGCTYNISIDHVVQLVGYGHDFGLNQDYWIVRNSWGPTWGENGFIRLIRESTPVCGWDVNPQDGTGCAGGPAQLWSCGQCGILFDTVYPNVQED